MGLEGLSVGRARCSPITARPRTASPSSGASVKRGALCQRQANQFLPDEKLRPRQSKPVADIQVRIVRRVSEIHGAPGQHPGKQQQAYPGEDEPQQRQVYTPGAARSGIGLTTESTPTIGEYEVEQPDSQRDRGASYRETSNSSSAGFPTFGNRVHPRRHA